MKLAERFLCRLPLGGFFLCVCKIVSTSPTFIGKRMYSQELIVPTFQYFPTSKNLYN